TRTSSTTRTCPAPCTSPSRCARSPAAPDSPPCRKAYPRSSPRKCATWAGRNRCCNWQGWSSRRSPTEPPGRRSFGAELPAGQLRGLPYPCRHGRLVQPGIFMDVEIARVRVLGRPGRHGLQRRAAKEGHLDVLGEAVKAEEPAAALDAVERRVPPHRLAHAGHGAHDQGIQ